MPNRVLRDWTTSETIDKLSVHAEVFFVRLIMKADDFGNYTANPKLLKAALFPLRDILSNEIDKWLQECVNVGIIKRYSVDDKDYLNIINFGQRLRAMKSQYPDYSQSDDGHVSDISRPETKRNEEETEVETKTLRALPFGDDFRDTWGEWLKYRKEKKQALKPTTEKKQLDFLGGRPENEAIAILEQSMMNGWTGLFEIKNKVNGTTKKEQQNRSNIEAFAKRVIERNQGE